MCFFFSVDVEKLFCSIPHKKMFLALRSVLKTMGTYCFRPQWTLALNTLSLLKFYLGAILVSFDSKLYVQKRGICIGSCLAPILRYIFLSAVNRCLGQAFNQDKIKLYRCVHDFLVVRKRQDFTDFGDFSFVRKVLHFLSAEA